MHIAGIIVETATVNFCSPFDSLKQQYDMFCGGGGEGT